jgi:CzcA family heavy metal efflux pump
MLSWIIAASMRFRLVIAAIAAATLVIGVNQLREAPVDTLPEFTPAYVEVQTEAPGLSADEVEQLITVPLEADLLNGVQDTEIIRSQSLPGLSSVVLVFKPGTDVYRGRQLVQERLTQLGGAAWPMISKPSVVLPPLSSSSRVLMIGLRSDDLTPIEQSVIARWTVRPRLMGVPGVANVAIWGMRDQQLQVQVDPEQLRDRNVTVSQVVETAGNAQVFSPLSFLEASTPGTGGFIETPQQRLQVRNVLETIADPASLGKVPVDETGGQLLLRDVADITVDHQPLIGDAVVNDGGGLLLVVEKFPGADTREVTAGVQSALDKLSPGLTGLETDTSVFRPSDLIDEALSNLALAGAIAALLAALILAAFLFQWRAVAIGLVTVPLALVAAAVTLDVLGETFNAISLAGLAIAVALVVDDAVVGAEAIAQRVRRRRDEGDDRSLAAVVLEATHAVRSPLAYATLIALVAIVPIAVMQGRPGDFFSPLVVAYAAAVVAAMVVALTVTPALAMFLFSRGSAGRAESPLLRRLRPRYDRTLSQFVRRPLAALIVAVAGVAIALAVLPFMGTSVVPSFKDRQVLVRLDGEPGMSAPAMTEIATGVTRELRSIDGVANVAAHIGRAAGGDQRVDVNSGEVWVSIDRDADYDGTMAAIENAVDDVSGVDHEVVTYSTQKMRDVGALQSGENPVSGDGLDLLTGDEAPLTVRVYGQLPDVLMTQAQRVRDAIADVSGVVDPRIQRPVTQATIEIEVDLDKARQFAIKPGDVRRAETTLLQGILVGSVFERQRVFDVVVQGTPETRSSIDAVRNLLIDRPGGGHVRLGQVADVRIGETPSSINRDAVSRRIDIVANVDGDAAGVAGDVEAALADMSFPLEYHAEVVTRTTTDEIGAGRILAVAIMAAIAAFFLLQAAFRSWRLAALAFLTLPVALVGGVLAALIAGAELSLGALAGLLAVFGLAARNGVLLIRGFQDLERDEAEVFGPGLVGRGARDRLAPVVTTAVALVAIALPFVILGGRPGLEVVAPMAAVVLGGVVTSTLLALFVLPALYLRFAAGGRRVPEPEEEELFSPWAVARPAPAVAGATATAAPAGVVPGPDRRAEARPTADEAPAADATEGNGQPTDGHRDDRKDESGAHEPLV